MNIKLVSFHDDNPIRRILAKWHRAEERVAKRRGLLKQLTEAFPGIPGRIVDHRLDELVKRTVKGPYNRRLKVRRVRRETHLHMELMRLRKLHTGR